MSTPSWTGCLAETFSLGCTSHCSWRGRKIFGIGSNTRWRSSSWGFPTEGKPAFSKNGHRVVQRFLWWKTRRDKRNRVPHWRRVLRTGAAFGAHDGGTTLPALTFCTIPRSGGRREHRRRHLHGGSRTHMPERKSAKFFFRFEALKFQSHFLLRPSKVRKVVRTNQFQLKSTKMGHMHAHIHRCTCISHTRTHTRSNATVGAGFFSSYSFAGFTLFSYAV